MKKFLKWCWRVDNNKAFTIALVCLLLLPIPGRSTVGLDSEEWLFGYKVWSSILLFIYLTNLTIEVFSYKKNPNR